MADKVNPEYQKSIEQIQKDGEDYADKQMQTVYKNQKDNLDELHKYLGLLYVSYAVKGLLDIPPLQRNKISKELDTKLSAIAKDMDKVEVKQVTNILHKSFTDTYYKNAFVLDSGMKINIKFNLLKKEYIDSAINNPIDGEIFSNRIWDNKSAVANKVKQYILDAMRGDTTIDECGKQIQQTFNVQAYESQRLVNTENTRVQSQAIDDIGNAVGVKKQLFTATLDDKTNPEDASYDGKEFDIDDPAKPVPPLHPFCRCILINIPPTGWTPTIRKDNSTKGYIDYKAYDKWANDKGIETD